MPAPERPKIYHIVHVDRLPHIIAAGRIFSDAYMQEKSGMGTSIGLSHIKARRLSRSLGSRPGLRVGECVPFYFCPRSVMLYLFYQNNHHDLAYRGGQEPIVHLVADMHEAIDWAETHQKRWAFTKSNAGSYYFEDYSSRDCLDAIDWNAVEARDWKECKEGKQAEFLLEQFFPWALVERIGVMSEQVKVHVTEHLHTSGGNPPVEVRRDWYY